MKRGLYWILAFLAACCATPWAFWHQGRIQKHGRKLTEQELTYAMDLGVTQPEEIYVSVVDRVPNPLHFLFSLLNRCGASCVIDAAGITLGRGIYLSADCAGSAALMAHELVHIQQYQRVGSIWAFMIEYIHQCLMHGYYDADWEVEARQESARVLA
ncbi:hypothetical protein NT6N_07060 [Oceaniferula spumae]|uniref:eCIS core domain-containing protein n=1 Tax=Oceaniferula spumae TaxID=2979115 RepID=A0AAT9FI94_9BACT